MSKKIYNTIVILSIGLICSIIFLGFCLIYIGKSIRYGFSHQATINSSLDLDLYGSEFVIKSIN